MLGNFSKLFYPILFIDTETTGLTDQDRVVSAGFVLLRQVTWNSDGSARLDISTTHLIFNPCRPSHIEALKIHGHTDWELQHQQLFSQNASDIASLFKSCRLVVGHNIAFDIAFLKREFDIAQINLPERPIYCTMRGSRASGLFRSAKLSEVAADIGLSRGTYHHGALEDAWLTMNIFLNLKVSPAIRSMPFSLVTDTGFENYCQPPPKPNTPSNRRQLLTTHGGTKRNA
jgi:DNA polymerase-3 subunit epsilon